MVSYTALTIPLSPFTLPSIPADPFFSARPPQWGKIPVLCTIMFTAYSSVKCCLPEIHGKGKFQTTWEKTFPCMWSLFSGSPIRRACVLSAIVWMPFSFVQVARQIRSSLHMCCPLGCLWLCPLWTLRTALSPWAPAPCLAVQNLQGRTPSEEERQHKVHEDMSLCLQTMSIHYWPLNIFLNISNILLR